MTITEKRQQQQKTDKTNQQTKIKQKTMALLQLQQYNSYEIALNCPNKHWDISNQPHFPPAFNPDNSPKHPQSPPKDTTKPDLGPPCINPPETWGLDLENNVGRKSGVECLLLGSSNCHHLENSADDDLRIQVASYIKGGMKIKNIMSKLGEMSKEKLNDFQTVVLLMGSTDFRVTH